ncbi:MobA/MobL family protein [uncultured Fusobacterium sp.]|uniref:MobA/MobL family protein n=1 Tax=uncultured Fusobacterium sp. TaxID=159267 RepID=UPI0015A64009|nr:MobA/MobL family protein [uncultured Fusobacterium sp.]
MAIYRLNTSNGRVGSASPHVNYIMGEGEYKYKQNEIIYQAHHMPNDLTPHEFWKLADDNEPVNGRTYREFKITLPHEFSKEENIELLNEFIKKELGNDYYYSVVIHDKESSEKGINNVHAHLMFSERKIDGVERKPEKFFRKFCHTNPAKGGAKKEPSWTKREKLLEIRKDWEDILNQRLEEKGIEKVSCKSLKEQKKEAIEAGDYDKAEYCDRQPVHVPGYILKKDVEKMELDELEQLNAYHINKEIYREAKEIYKNSLKSKEQKEVFNELDNRIDSLNKEIHSNKYTFDNFSIAEANFNMLSREIYKTEFLLQKDNLEREVIRQIAPEYDFLLLERDNLIDRYESQKAKNIEVDSDTFYKKLAEIDDKLSSLPAPNSLEVFETSKEKIREELEKKLENYKLNQLKFKKDLDDIKANIGSVVFNHQLLAKEFRSNFERTVECKYELRDLDRKLNRYNNNLNREKLHNSALNIYSKGEFNKINNLIKALNDQIGVLEPQVYYKTGATEEIREKNKKDLEILNQKLAKAQEQMKAFENKYGNKNAQIKIAHIEDNMEKKYRTLIDKALIDKKLLTIELELVHKRLVNAPLNNKEVRNIIDKYSLNHNIFASKIEKNTAIINKLNNNLKDKNLSNLTLNKLSGGIYYKIIKEYSKLSDKFEKIDKELGKIKFYEIEKRISLNKDKKIIKDKLEGLEKEYNQIKSMVNSKEFNETFKELKDNFEKIIADKKSEIIELKSSAFENKEKDYIASSIEKEISYVSSYFEKMEYTKEQHMISYSSNNEEIPQGGGGGNLLEVDEERWKKKKKGQNMFEKGFSL